VAFEHMLTDIRLDLRHASLRPVYRVATDRRRVPTRAGVHDDIGVVDGLDNLEQAVFLRLLTPLGELAPLGHPEYGSRLYELIGEQNTETRRNLARLFILQALALEPRIAEVVEVVMAVDPAHREGVRVTIRARPAGATDIVVIGPFVLELES
jgi:phage baseplate assembly protein W